MGRRQRYIPAGGALVEVTCRTVQGRLLFRPDRDVNEIVTGVLVRARSRYPVELSGAVYLSNHCHLLVRSEEAKHLADFMEYLNGNLAREICRLRGWSDKVWAHRFDAILISNEPESQIGRMKYLLSQGVKEGLVARPQDWPGVHCARALLTGNPLEGYWFDRTREYACQRRGRKFDPYAFAEKASLTFDKLPCWAHLSDDEYRERIAGLIDEIIREGSLMRRSNPVTLPGAKTLRRQDPQAVKGPPPRKPKPRFHAFRRKAREELHQAEVLFVAAYRSAARRLRRGESRVSFPRGCFPPGLPYVPHAETRPP